MKTVKQVSQLSGVSVRTLHHYDAIGLLRPTQVTEAGYRLYDDAALQRLQIILLLRELEFPLREIRQLLVAPDFDPISAIDDQIRLLELRRQHLDDLLTFAHQIQSSGVIPMDFKPFDTENIDRCAAEAKARWGETSAYREYERKSAPVSGDALMRLLAEAGKLRPLGPSAPQVQSAVADLQHFITAHYYTCTMPILANLGQMYISDPRFRENIDRAGGPGCAEFLSEAIAFYCK